MRMENELPKAFFQKQKGVGKEAACKVIQRFKGKYSIYQMCRFLSFSEVPIMHGLSERINRIKTSR